MKKPFWVVLCLWLTVGGAWINAQDDTPDENVAVRVSSENFLPASTTLWLSVPDVLTLQTKFDLTDFGRLTHDSDMQPFIEAMTSQVRDWANKKNVRLGLTVDDIAELDSGEICVAGILPRDAGEDAAVGRGSHGLVFLVDVTESPDAARDLMKKVAAKMDDQGAERIEMDSINGAEVAKWKWELKNKKTGRTRSYTTLHTLTDGWLIASDNETIFRDVIRRVKNPADGAALDTLSAHTPFEKIQQETQIEGAEPHIRFFVDPFGYMKLADAIAAEDKAFRQKKDNIGEVLESQGFDAIKGMGGSVSFASDNNKDVIYRAFVYTPPRNVGEAQKRARGILDFRNKWKHDLSPEKWIVGDGAGYATFTWDAESAFENVGQVFDAFVDPEVEGDWDNIVSGVSADMDVDLRAMVGQLDNRFTIMSAIEHPIDVRSERVVIGMKITGDVDKFYDMVVKLLPEGTPKEVKGRKIHEIDTTVEIDDGLLIEDDPVFGGSDVEEEDEEEVELFNLFEKRYFTVIPGEGEDGGYLLVCNNEEYLLKVIELGEAAEKSALAEADDFKRVTAVLDGMVDAERISFRQFGRTDKIIEANYEMMRKGKMAESQTVLARILNEIFKDPEADADSVRAQQIDGSTLPDDFSESVAPFFGPAGWAMETKDDGWRITGVVLKKKGGSEVVQKTDEEKSRR